MDLPLSPPIDPMLAKLTRDLPVGEVLYEPKWDGFRCLVFRDGDELLLQSRNGRPLDRYFPEIGEPLRQRLPDRVVLDGELVVPGPDGLDFDALSNRIHPAGSRVTTLSEATPAHYVAFDLLAVGDEDLSRTPFGERRERLIAALEPVSPPVHLSPATRDPHLATDWFVRFEGAGLDGVIVKDLRRAYAPGKRTLLKAKRERTADVVVAGFRWHKDGQGVGSLLLGLFDAEARLVNVGVASSFSAARRSELVEELAGVRVEAGETIEHPWLEGDGAASRPRGEHRWSAGRDTSWEPLHLDTVAEVAYDQLQGDRFRHSARFRRWRPDRDVGSCRFDQLQVPPPAELAQLFALRS